MAPPTPIPIADRDPGPADCDRHGRCWWGQPHCWVYADCADADDTHWLPCNGLPLVRGDHEPEDCEPDDDWHTHPSLTAAERNPSLCAR